MSDSNSLSNRYQELIDSIVDITLQGKIRSKEQVYRMLVKEIESGTGEIFERVLDEKIQQTTAQLEKKIKSYSYFKGITNYSRRMAKMAARKPKSARN